MSKENCACCAIVHDNEGQHEGNPGGVAKGFFLSGVAFGVLHLADDLPLRLCETCQRAGTAMVAELRAKFEKVNGYPLGDKPAPTPKGTTLN